MALTSVTYNTLKIAPFEMRIHEVMLIKRVNDHGRLTFTGIIPEEKEDQYIMMASEQTVVELKHVDENGNDKTLFHGKILKLNVKVEKGIYWLEAEAISHSYDMDIGLVNRAFQDKTMTIEKVLKDVSAPYHAIINNTFSEPKQLGNFTLQYQETDWQFMKRMASHYHAPLITLASRDSIGVYLGIPDYQDYGEIKATHYRVYKDLKTFQSLGDPKQTGLSDQDFICYEVVMDQVLELGDQVTFKNQKLHVFEVKTEMNRGVLTHTYVLCQRKAGYQKVQFNTKIVGASIQGKVAAVVRDQVKVKLDYDHEWNLGKAHLFPYSTMYASEDQTGWYAMPEVGDDIRINFPSAKEGDGIAISSVRKRLPQEAGSNSSSSQGQTRTIHTTVVKQEKLQPIIHYDQETKEDLQVDPNTKYLMTSTGQKITFKPDRIVISSGGGASITLTNAGTVLLDCNSLLTLKTNGRIEMSGEIITMVANQIEMSTEEGLGSLKIDEGQVLIKGVEMLMDK
ncbi:MAG: hypothetical protein E7L01_04965 [Paenibacillus macerans]|uniref:hypothetical protein n=1 Tax=Paenibacillus TaxID=44249 RepID=UPI000EBCE35B|nr:hypothetical protein [Paenibacillus macerans]MBS5909190.1 hypothetical protein [Paenibacillus macerans]MDU5946827.1 hypothetical protein [Paenibacillus macerans]MDU7472701.1 hypothetical protein [Paenibacillus macerans]MEC0139070.1 hypothetical protein [Paenibacillus macerans]UMV47820.1 phage late control D family protein [Paenibacillus macerans]